MNKIKLLAASGALLISFSITSYIIGENAANNIRTEIQTEEQRQDDFINEVVGSSIVEIRDTEGKKGGGTGFFVNTPSDNTFILTNNHICNLSNESGLVLIDQEYYAQVIARSSEHDLCLISNPLNWAGISVASTSRNGQNVYIIGHPLLDPMALIKGQISGSLNVPIFIGYDLPCDGKNEKKEDLSDNPLAGFFGISSSCVRILEAQATTLNILPGNSGSPCVDHAGKLVGVAFAGRDDGPGRGYIVPLSYIIKFLADK